VRTCHLQFAKLEPQTAGAGRNLGIWGRHMAADKLVLITPSVKWRFQKVAKNDGMPLGGYSNCMDLRETKFKLPVRLFCGGLRSGVCKLDFIDVRGLGLKKVEEIVDEICKERGEVRIFRVDWAVDVLGLPVWELIERSRIAGVQNTALYRSRTGTSFYPHLSKRRSVLIYERLRRLRTKRDPVAKVFRADDVVTRLEVQLRGQGVIYRDFSDIRKFGEIDLLAGVRFRRLRKIRDDLTLIERFAAERVRDIVAKVGLQNFAKQFRPGVAAYLESKFFAEVRDGDFPDLRSRMRESIKGWLNDNVRFPRAPL
jgi:hypothetical protein